jgi:hypothetical protein
MAILITSHNKSSFTLFAGRVLQVQKVTETRNWSDTLDYTDHRSTECTYALVWLGTHGVPPTASGRDGRTHANWESLRDPTSPGSEYDTKPRDLEYWEQFAWVDCTNLFTWRGSDHRVPEVDAEMGSGGEPLMWANYLAWQAHQKSLAAAALRAAAEQKAARDAELAKEAAKKAARAAKSDAERAGVEAMMAHTPAKGSTCTVDGFTGKVFWKGVKLYRNRWRGTVGLKDAKGAVAWIDVSHWVAYPSDKVVKPAKKSSKK